MSSNAMDHLGFLAYITVPSLYQPGQTYVVQCNLGYLYLLIHVLQVFIMVANGNFLRVHIITIG